MLRRNTPYGNIIYMLIQLKVTRKWPEDLLSYRFILTKQDIQKRYLLLKIVYIRVRDWTSIEVKPLRTKLYWVASQPLPGPPTLPRAFHQLYANFLQLLVLRATFCIISEQFLLLVFFQFWDIWAAFSACLNWSCFHISQCFSRQFMNFPWKRSQILTPWGQMMGARCSRAEVKKVIQQF